MNSVTKKVNLRESYTILVVDDNPIDRATTMHMLSLGIDAEYIPLCASNVSEAVEILENSQQPLDLAILDYHLIDKTAEDILQHIDRTGRDLPVIVATSFATKRKENQLLKYGIYDFWDKNLLNPAALEHSIRFALNRHELSQARYKSHLLQGQTLASVVHDLKNPISTISSYNKIAHKLVKNGNANDCDRIEICFDTIAKNCQLLQHLVQEILELSKSESSDLQFSREPLNVLNILSSCIQDFTPKAEEHGLKIEAEIEEPRLQILANTDKMTQVFNNLISNAIKYTDDGSIHICATRERHSGKDWAKITFKDTGIGIGEDDLDKIFEPFNNVEHITQKPVDSHGLGLSIVKKLVEAHDGEISVTSKKGHGSTFTIRLPLA